MPHQARLAVYCRAGTLCLSLALPLSAPAAPAAAEKVTTALDQVRLLAAGVRDGAAVLQLADQQMVVLKAGDTVPGTRAVVMKVATDKLVLQEGSASGQERQLVWMYKAGGTGPGRIERFASHVAAAEAPMPPATTVLRISGAAGGASLSAHP